MKVPLSWLKDFLPLAATPQEIAETLTLLGIEVEKITGMTTSFTGIVVGKVLQAEQHPNADRLRVARVTDGMQEYQVVCGAPNCREGIFVAFARVGAELTDEEGKKWKIKKSKLRDVESEGMLCASSELQLSEESDGKIIELSSDLPLGSDLSQHVNDPVFDISLTPNLGHALSVLGIARELAAAYKTRARRPASHLKETGSKKMVVEVADPRLCPRYACRIMTQIKVGPSPDWLQKRLLACGLRPINNIVDIGNYVMWELGQPLHIFDLDKIDQKIVVAPANRPLSLETLDGQKREIPPQTLLIQDSEKPLALAGIMGGSSSAATEKTTNILIESAVFDAGSIRKTSRLLDLKTDASYRFDRGIDGGNVVHALNRAAELIEQIAGGEIHPLVDIKQQDFVPRVIACRLERLKQILGFSLSLGEAAALFERLEMQVKTTSQDLLEVAVPTYRNDLQQEIDLIEEAARLFGYNNIPRGRPSYTGSTLPDAPIYRLEKETRSLLLEQGLQECITCDLISPALAQLTMEKGLPENSTIHVLHPRSVDQSTLRTSLLGGLLQTVKHNLNHQIDTMAAFEVGRIHFREKNELQEASCAGIILTGKTRPHHFDRKPHDVDFYDLKALLENLCESLRLARYSFEPSHLDTLHPWRQIKVKSGDITIGVMGEIHPELLLKLDIQQRVYFAELNLHEILPLKKKARLFSELAAFPSSERDWTLTLKENVPIATVLQAMERTKSPFLEHFYLLDLYTSDQLGKDRKNVTFRFRYRDPAKTMSFEAVEQEHQKLTHSVAEKLRDCLL
ncbi:MAG: phenylalanine--tRNA ligase subunit beta [Verrucomicrobia bacterium]|nr:phenylalanine--tRNA ligase subunit beta [Verrucomicrobiota bacterium]